MKKKNQRLKRILLNIGYYCGIGVFVTWCFKLGITDWLWWLQIIMISIIINAHRDIDKFINN